MSRCANAAEKLPSPILLPRRGYALLLNPARCRPLWVPHENCWGFDFADGRCLCFSLLHCHAPSARFLCENDAISRSKGGPRTTHAAKIVKERFFAYDDVTLLKTSDLSVRPRLRKRRTGDLLSP